MLIFLFISIFSKGQNWEEVQQIIEDDAFSVDIDGNFAIVGDIDNDTDANNQNNVLRAGAAFIYQKTSSGNWTLMQKIVASDRSPTDGFGVSVAISSEGVAVVGTQATETAYVFELVNGLWNEVQTLAPSTFQNEDKYGNSIAMHGDRLVVGAPWRRLSDSEQPGAAYLYVRNPTTGIWSEIKEIAAPTNDNASFGFDVDIADNYLVIGAPNQDGPGGELSIGAAYVYSAATGLLEATLEFPLLQPGDRFGNAVAISGSTIFTGIEGHALNADGSDDQNALNDGLLHPGIVGIFEGISWELTKVVSPNRTANGQFGFSVDVWNNTAIVGANQEGLDADEVDFKAFSGAAYMLSRSTGGGWSITQQITPINREAFDQFGTKVAIAGNNAIILGEEKAFTFETCSEIAPLTITASSTSICEGQSVTLSITGDDLASTNWVWHSNSCQGPLIASGISVELKPDETTTYFLRNGNSCETPLECQSITINVTNPLTLNAITQDEVNGDDGSIDLTINGGEPPYEFDWHLDGTGDWDDNEDLTDLSVGIYVVSVRDNNGCIQELSAEINSSTITNINGLSDGQQIIVYPNPSIVGEIQIETGDQPVKLDLISNNGKILESVSFLHKGILKTDHLAEGVYFLKFVTNHKVVTKRLLIR